ncbi:unnamed protein product [Dracunculus medinensis]|uniref:EF-hand domain-containing protein n=1 Tax=Dracunculus medinensis TaxID=318479 RepID=A0A0N4UA38_DRAME|nr:unnamed protein product [Dracunculus medinensis]
MSEKDQIFWDALMCKNDSIKLKHSKKYLKSIDVEHFANQFTIEKKEVEKIYGLFLNIDNDKSGGITATEIAQALGSLGCDVSPKVVQAVMRTTDKNGDGEINFEEFLAVVISKYKLRKNKKYMDEVIKKLAENGDKQVTAENLRDAWSLAIGLKLTLHEANAIIARADVFNNGVVTQENFTKMWKNI